MAMDKGDLADAMIDGLKDIDDATKAMSELGKAIKGYVEDNCEIDYSWTAMNPVPPPGAPDPTTSFTSEVMFPVFMLSSPPDMAAFGPIITGAVAGGIIKHPPDFVVPPGMFLPIPIMLTQSDADNQADAMEHLADEIISGIKKMINPVPLPGIHAAFVLPTPGAIMTGIK